MTHGSVRTGRKPGEAPLRILCGSLTLGLSLICVYASFSRAIQGTGGEAVTSWIFFAWGCATAIGGAWVIRGRSKGQPIVFARDRKRLILVASLAISVAGMLIVLAVQFSTTGDEEWPFLLQTMFAVLFASVLFLLFEREDSKEQTAPKPLTAAGRRKARRLLIVMVLVGVLTLTVGLAAGVQTDSWWEEGLSRLGTALLAAAAVLGYRLKTNR
ncbi:MULTISPECIES: hypothetical protein [unclassified Arthrobacter]|uniref:hypothetical protein n=1 Tax=unclassified Arthrobacter TaxID=235627 RepID=UPI001D149313|nr:MULTISPECIES: hypothetical protein [unclassified Arthrobacter]MCC3274477.1 hypothetical protein [Arthrobacter sp. zg-Y20]MCC3279530.1 hypothetical protein [Arthrobacter sp. zg-Y40]MCC9177930.1 hypothetical protein [Arthrobacter sp. zg-Y750]MDK1314634.1 hypothetical protein [Arthrobacter sp. zg.Y20]MDK1327519.1 hypothetical protein [Arthrobacter sp. zg-Y1143]